MLSMVMCIVGWVAGLWWHRLS